MTFKVRIYKLKEVLSFDTETEADREADFQERVYGYLCKIVEEDKHGEQ